MKVYDEKIVPEQKVRYLKIRKCDLCGREAEKDGEWIVHKFQMNETIIKINIQQKEGSTYPEGGSGTEYEIDLCPDCFKNRLIPWLKAAGTKIEKKAWDW